jgi:uncharacterized protein (TIGR03437 family)
VLPNRPRFVMIGQSSRQVGSGMARWIVLASVLFFAASAPMRAQSEPGRGFLQSLFESQLAGGLSRAATITVTVVGGATLAAQAGYAPNSFATVFGSNFVRQTMVWDQAFSAGRAPTELGGVSIRVNGRPAFISFTMRGSDFGVNYDQVNFVLPDDDSVGDVSLEVVSGEDRSQGQVIRLQNRAPSFFVFDPQNRRFLAAVQNDFSAFVGPEDLFGAPTNPPTRPARPGDVVALFGTGFGTTNPPVPAGQIPQGGERLVEEARVFFGQTPATVHFAGYSTFVGVVQIVISVPNVAAGDHEVTAEIAGLRTQSGAYMRVAQ